MALDPFSWLALGALLTAGGTGMGIVGANQASRAQDNALSAERARQDQMSREAAAANTKAQDRYADIAGQQAAEEARLRDLFRAAPTAAPQALADANVASANVLPSAPNDIVMREVNKQQTAADAFTGQQADARARLRSFGSLFGDIGLGVAQDAGEIGRINTNRRASQDVLPFELQAAAQKGAGLRTFGDIFRGLGAVALTAGAPGLSGLFSGGQAPIAGLPPAAGMTMPSLPLP